jgi:putative membrane protein
MQVARSLLFSTEASMRNIRSAAAGLFVAVSIAAVSGCARTSTRGGTSSAPTTGATEAQAGPNKISATDEKFFRDAYSDARAELVIGQMAERKGTTPQVKDLGRKLVTDSTRQQGDLKNLASKNHISLLTSLEARDQAAVSHLRKATGQTFDRDFLTHVRLREQAVLNDMQQENKAGTNPELKSYASTELSTVRAQVDQARSIGVAAPQKGVTAPQK